MSLLTIALFISLALLDSAHGHQCYAGYSRNSETCEVSLVECGDQPCLTVSQYYEMEGKIYPTIYKNCSNGAPCGDLLSLTQDSVKIRVSFACCTGDKCNDDAYTIPPDNTEPNGVVCPSCFKKGSLEECVTDKTIMCTGGETKCVEYIGTAEMQDLQVIDKSLKACISKLGCDYGFSALFGVVEKKRVKFECTP